MIASGRMTTPGEMVENFGKNWRMDRARKKLADEKIRFLRY
jgi:hypothetical protein